MKSRPIMLLDIGSTLVCGPSSGPASRIASQLGLTAEQKRVLHEALMTTDFETPEEVCAFIGSTLGLTGDPAARVTREVWSAQENDAEPVPGAAEALARMQRKGWRLGLISNIWRPYLVSVRRHFGAFFDRYIPSDLQLLSFELGLAKPSPAIFIEALRRAGVPAGQAVMVGDSYCDDIQPAAALGMATVWVLSRPHKESAALARVGDGVAPRPSQIVPSLDALDLTLLSCANG